MKSNDQLFWEFYKLFDKSLYLDELRTKRDIEFICNNLPVDRYKTILDLGCGSGRISIPLSKVGYKVTGVDFDKEAIKEAKGKVKNNKNLKFLNSDYRDLDIKSKFDAILFIYSSFGYFDDEKNIKILKKIRNLLKDKGVLILDNLNYYWAVKKKEGFWKDLTPRFKNSYLSENNISKIERLREITDDHKFEKTTYRITKNNNDIEVTDFKQRILSRFSMEKMLKAAGFEIVKFFGDFDSTIYSSKTPRIIVITRRI